MAESRSANTAEMIRLACIRGMVRGSPFEASQTTADPSSLAVTTQLWVLANCPDRTLSRCLSLGPTGAPVCAFQIAAEKSSLDVTTRVPSGLNAAWRTPSS